MQVRTKIKTIATVALMPFLAVFVLNIEKWAESKGYDSILVDLSAPDDVGLLGEMLALALSPWALMAAFAASGFVAGLWIDALLRRSEHRRAENLQELARRMATVVSDINHREEYKRSNQPDDLRELWATYLPVALSIEKIGLRAPKCGIQTGEEAVYVRSYLQFVGPLIKEGHMKIAKKTAANLTALEYESKIRSLLNYILRRQDTTA